jgi:predicted PurR-regulated permease PerM
MDYKRTQTSFFFLVLIGTLVLLFFVFRPFLYPLLFAGAFALVFEPLEKKVGNLVGKKRAGISAFLTTALVFLIILIPLWFFGTQVFYEGKDLYEVLTRNGTDSALAFAQNFVHQFFPETSLNFSAYATQLSKWVVTNIGPIFSGVTQILTGVLISFLALFFFLKDGSKMKEALYTYSPLEDRYDKEIVKTLTQTTRSVVKGTLVVSILQGIAAGIGFWIFGVPSPALWGLVTVVAALIPLVGTMLVVLPATLYLALTGAPIFALGMFAWGALIVSMIDNVLRPILMEREVNIHPFLIFLSVIGGLQFFGPAGFLLGPLVLSLIFTLFNIYGSMMAREAHKE